MRTFSVVLIVAAALVSGCSDSSGPKVGPPANVVVVSQASVNQQGIVGQATPVAPSVLVTDSANRPVPGVTVAFVITSGDGTLSSASAVTGSNGEASVTWTLGTTFGTKSMTATVQGLPPVTFTAKAVAPDAGIVAFNLTDPANDTLPNTTGSASKAIDLLSLHGDFKRDSLIVTFTYAAPVTSGSSASNSVAGFLELNMDDNASTGQPSASNSFGASSSGGIEYVIGMSSATGTTVPLLDLSTGTTQSVTASFSGNTVIVRVPVSMLGNDDGNFSFVGVIGTVDRPTDVFPNAGNGTVRRSVGVSPSVLGARVVPSPVSARIPVPWGAALR
jgi:Bacterial Ig-like domain (group 1)